MEIHVRACQEGEPVMVLDDGRIILGEAGHVALIIRDDARGEVGTVMLDTDQAAALTQALTKERWVALRYKIHATLNGLRGRA